MKAKGCNKCACFAICADHNEAELRAFVARPYTSQMERSLQQGARKELARAESLRKRIRIRAK